MAAAAAGGTSIGGAVGKFFLSVLIATAIGVAVGWSTLFIRKRIKQATVNTLLSFAVPLIAFQPAEHAGASGLVAVVAAGLVIGHAAPRFLAPGHRANERINWHTIEMLLEGGLFLIMGLQLVTLLDEEGARVGLALSLAASALGIALAARALYTIPLLRHERKAHRRYEAARGKLEDMRDGLVQTEAAKRVLDDRENKVVASLRSRVRRVLADADYLAARPLGWRDAILLVWAGMRGAITLAAAQTLPADFPHRSLLVLVAFLVATGSLLIQGGTLAWVVRRLHFAPSSTTEDAKEREALTTVVIRTGVAVVDSPTARHSYGDVICDNMKERLANMRSSEQMEHAGHLVDEIFDAQRNFILDARNDGSYSTETLAIALRRVDAMQLGMSMSRRGRIGDDD